jgi:hypothetical protein
LVRALAALILLAAPAAAECRQGLVLALDVSASVNAREYRLQAEGTAAALRSPAVRAILLDAAAPPVALAAFLWSGPEAQALILPWRLIDGPAALEAAAARIASAPRPPVDGRTAIGAAMLYAQALMAAAPGCAVLTLDISGDGESNAGPAPRTVRLAGVTVNALAVKGDLPMDHGDFATHVGELSAYFAAHVIHGPGAFVERAWDYDDFAAAMTRKLLRELAPPLMGAAGR